MSGAAWAGRRSDLAIGAAVALAWFCVLLATVDGVGLVRDEGYYFEASARAAHYWLDVFLPGLFSRGASQAFTENAINLDWAYNAEHPALLKTLFGLSERLFHGRLGWVGESSGFRLPGMASAALLMLFTYLFAARTLGRAVGLSAVALLATLPRLFHDSHLACFDVPIAAASVAVVDAWSRSRTDRRWGLALGVLLGLAVATKLNAFFLPLGLLAHLVLRQAPARPPTQGGPKEEWWASPALVAIASMAVLAPLLFVAHWPWLWTDTAEHLRGYLRFHLQHEYYAVEYFGALLSIPPYPSGTWAFPFVMTAVTVPLASLALMSAGLVRGAAAELSLGLGSPWRGDAEAGDPGRTRLLLLIQALLPLLVIAMPRVPVFGGVKHWYTAMPFLCILAAAELVRLARVLLRRPALEKGALAGAAAAVAASGALGIALVHPNGTAFYNEAIGGLRGAAEHGMMRGFWGHMSRAHLDFLNRHVGPGEKVFFQRTNLASVRAYQREGLLREDIGYAAEIKDADWAVIFKQRVYDDQEYQVWTEWGATRPVAGLYLDEVPMCLVYRRRPGEASR